MKIDEIVGFKCNGFEAIEAKLNGTVIWKYEEGNEEIDFSISPFPTNWTAVTTGTKYNASNDYGDWVITASSYKDNTLDKCFDADASTYFRSGNASITNSTVTVDIICPKLICPKKIYVKYQYTKNAELQGFNLDTNNWETLHTFSYSSTSANEETVELTTQTFYSQFRISSGVYNLMTYSYIYLHEFQIQSGSMRDV